ncbi:hypothetical protein [Actinorhabdospora filicis]|uniref:hypothetical protein n=1 Tax=Actinorhabdospora filicis TaxID=1785913 RepID=UPI00255345EE|nr:hypothetical protein [Actinorhabdospora filicis]
MSHVPFRARWRALVAASAIAIPGIAVIVGAPAASADTADACAKLATDAAVESEYQAQRLAMQCDAAVEVLEKASSTVKITARPGGDFSYKGWLAPHRVERNDRWIDIDTTLVAGSDGLLRPKAAADVSFSPGGTAPFARWK